MSKDNKALEVKNEVVISCFNTIDYYFLNKDFYQIPDTHPFWEMVYVDKGIVISNYNGIGHSMSEGEIIFHPPKSMHSHISNKSVSSAVLVVSFSSDSELLNQFKQKTFFLSSTSKKILANFIEECNNILGDIENMSSGLPRNFSEAALKSDIIGATQLLSCYFIEFLYSIIRSSSRNVLEKTTMSYAIASNSLITIIQSYLHDNVYKNITLNDLCYKFNMSKSALCRKWKEQSDSGIIDYFISLKVKEAKKLIKQNEHNVTEIAEMLGYSTIHHFSHLFKKWTGVSPTEYKNSILK